MKSKQKWFWICLVAALLSAPNALVLHHTSATLDPLLINAVRFGLAGFVFLPILFRDMPRLLMSKKSYWRLFLTAFSLAVTGVAYVIALGAGPASYVSILFLLTPIALVLYARRIANETIPPSAIAGITLAAIGAMLMILLPLLETTGGKFAFYPIATAAALIAALTYPASVVLAKNTNKRYRVHILSIVSFSSLLTALVSIALWYVTRSDHTVTVSTVDIWALIYAGLVVLGLSRVLTLQGYKYVSTPVLSSLYYFESFLAIVLPVLLLHESLSPEMVIGGSLILLGVYTVEHHKSKRHKHHNVLRP